MSIGDFIIDLAYQYRFSLGAKTDPIRVIEGSEGVTTTTAEGGRCGSTCAICPPSTISDWPNLSNWLPEYPLSIG